MNIDKAINELIQRIEDLKKRFPAHSLQGHMFAELEQLEDELAELIRMKRGDVMGHKFNPKMIDKLENPARREILPPEQTIEKMGISNDQVVIDVGCGIGYFTFPLASKVGASGFVYGLDIFNEMIAEVERRYATHEIKSLNNIQFLKSEENAFPLQDNIGDVVLLVNVFHELDDPAKLLKEISRVLKGQGKVAIVDWQKVETQMGPPIDHRISVDEVQNILEANGYQVIEIVDLTQANYLVMAELCRF